MGLAKLGKGLRFALRRPAGRMFCALLVLILVFTGIPRIEAHAHAQGEASHAPMVHQGFSIDHAHHDGHDHESGHTQHPKGDGSPASERMQHVHLLPHAVALPPSVTPLPEERSAPPPVATRGILRLLSRPDELFRPPIA
jgi:hypothetical protein